MTDNSTMTDQDQKEQQEYMMAQIKGTVPDRTLPTNIKYVSFTFKGLPSYVSKNFNLPKDYPPFFPFEFPYPSYYEKLEQFIHHDPLSKIFKTELGGTKVFNQYVKSFASVFELPLGLFIEILAWYCTAFEVKWKKSRDITLFEYAELGGVISEAMKRDPYFKDKRLSPNQYNDIHKCFLRLLSNWQYMLKYYHLIKSLEEDKRWFNDTDDFHEYYEDMWDDWYDDEGKYHRSPRLTKEEEDEEDEGDGKEDV